MRRIRFLLIAAIILSASITEVLALQPSNFSIEKAFETNPKEMPKLGVYDYSKEYFKLRFLTPLSGYRYAVKNKDKAVYHKNKRKKNQPYSLKEEDLNEMDFWSYKEPYVTVMILPQPQTKNVVKVGRLLGYTTAAAFTIGTLGIGMATLGLPGKIEGYKVSKDFYNMTVLNKDKELICENEDKEMRVMSKTAQQYFFPDDHFDHFVDKLFLGTYKFNPACFMTDEKIRLVIKDKNGKKTLNFKVPDKLKDAIIKDFELGARK